MNKAQAQQLVEQYRTAAKRRDRARWEREYARALEKHCDHLDRQTALDEALIAFLRKP